MADPGRPDALAPQIRAMAAENGQCKILTGMGERGRRYVEQHFERGTILGRWDDLLTSLA